MKLSPYTMFAPHPDTTDSYLMFNTRTNGLCVLTSEWYHALHRLPESDERAYDPRILTSLYEQGFIIRSEDEEYGRLAAYYDQIENRSDILTFEVTLLTTLACNFACDYCYEEHAKNHVRMSPETSELVIAWLCHEIEEHAYAAVHITYYGGEPLLHPEPIAFISGRMQVWCREHAVKFSFGMITNGYLVKREHLVAWQAIGMTMIRITIDGDKDSHDAHRPLLSGEGTFDVIMKNVRSIIDCGIKVSLSGNYGADNPHAMIRLLDLLEQEGMLYKFDEIGFSPVLPRLGQKSAYQSVELSHCMKLYEHEYHEHHRMIRTEMQRRHLKVPAGLTYMACMLVQRHNGVVVAPEGHLYKCPTMIGYPEFSVGHVSRRGYNAKAEEFLSLRVWKQCEKDCAYLPVCNGGCRFMAYIHHGSFHAVWCEKEHLKANASHLIQLDYKRARVKPQSSSQG